MSAPEFDVTTLGVEGEYVVTIDGFSPHAEVLERDARSARYSPAGHHYPGVRAAASPGYLGASAGVLETVLREVFGITGGASLVECSYSMVTTPPEALTPIQRLPHFDGADEGVFALLHYLCDETEGGTGFYRHRGTGYERITGDRLDRYDAALRTELAEDGVPEATYFLDDTPRFERIGTADARYNRMVIYRGVQLHSGDILKAGEIGQPGHVPRLTINTFMRAK